MLENIKHTTNPLPEGFNNINLINLLSQEEIINKEKELEGIEFKNGCKGVVVYWVIFLVMVFETNDGGITDRSNN